MTLVNFSGLLIHTKAWDRLIKSVHKLQNTAMTLQNAILPKISGECLLKTRPTGIFGIENGVKNILNIFPIWP
jgi:hypothetical protein